MSRISIKGNVSANMSRPWLGSEREGGIASLACMRAALEAADGGAARGLEKLGVKVPEADSVTGLYRARQFKQRHLHAAARRIREDTTLAGKGAYNIEDYDYLEAHRRFKAQPDTQAARERRIGKEDARYFPKRARPALMVDEMPAAGGSRRAGRPWVHEMPASYHRRRAGGPDVQEISPAEARETAARRRARLLQEVDWDQVDAALEGFEYPEEELAAGAYVAPKRRRLAPVDWEAFNAWDNRP